MLPLATDAPRPRRAPVTWALLAVNAAVFLLELALPAAALETLFLQLGVVPARLTDPALAADVAWWVPTSVTFVTTMFLHGGWAHVLGNMWTLWIFGRGVEGRLGPARFLAFYLASGLAAGVLHALFAPASVVPAIGASGAIAGVMGAALLLFPLARLLMVFPILFYPLVFQAPAVVYLGFWFLTQLLQGSASLLAADAAGGVAWWAHVGGFLAGLALLGWFLRPTRPSEEDPGAPPPATDLRPGHELLRPVVEGGRSRLVVVRRGR